MADRRLRLLALLCALCAPPARAAEAPKPAPWALPAEGNCQPEGGLRSAPGDDAPPQVPFRTGDSFDIARLEALRHFVPKELWQYRERFFYEGMRLEIGPCFRDYSAPAFYRAATEKLIGQAKLDADGGLSGFGAGQPFPPEAIDPADPQAGLRWAWDVAERYQGAGFRGKFRVTDLLGRVGRAEPFEGEIFKLDVSHRADRPDSGYALSFAKGNHWVAGGKLFAPFAARDYAWRQYRNDESMWKANRSDDLVAFLPEWRRVRRIPAADIEGLHMPSFSVGVVPSKQLVVGSGGGGFGSGGVSAAGSPSGVGGGTIQTKRSGFEGLEIRPVLWSYRVVGVQDLLAPINVAAPMYPAEPNREFGPWGLSFASDRWDLRRTLVLEARVKGEPSYRGESRLVMYVDLQTLVPLYYISYSKKEEPIDIGIFAGRWSEDRPDYPRWPDDPARPVRVIDSVGAAFANLAEEGSWRRESWELVSTPPPDAELKKLESSTDLTKGR
jgi:hypothetical protein